jgi:hypothetical protein
MSGSAQGVTPAGVRDGELGALQALTATRGGAVLAFCRAVCGEELAPRAAAEAFARFRAAVCAADQVSALQPDALLFGATRHAAASLAPAQDDVQHATPGLLTRARGRPGGESCAVVPTLLAARAEHALGPADDDRLERHLSRCPACRAIAARFQQAERAYGDPPEAPVPEEAAAAILVAMTAAAPVGPHAPQAGDDIEMFGGPPELPEPDADVPEAEVEPEPDEEPEPEPAKPMIAIRGRPDSAAPVPEPGPAHPTRMTAGWIVLPIALMAAGVLCAMAIAGVFGGDDPTPVRSLAVHVAVEQPRTPVTTPLPVTVAPPVEPPVIPPVTTTTP